MKTPLSGIGGIVLYHKGVCARFVFLQQRATGKVSRPAETTDVRNFTELRVVLIVRVFSTGAGGICNFVDLSLIPDVFGIQTTNYGSRVVFKPNRVALDADAVFSIGSKYATYLVQLDARLVGRGVLGHVALEPSV